MLAGLPDALFLDREPFLAALDQNAKASDLKLSAAVKKAILNALSERDENAAICRDKKGAPEPDSSLRETDLGRYRPYSAYKASGVEWLGEIPSHWEVGRNRSMFIEVDERTETGDEELLTVSHITGVTRRSEKQVTMIKAESHEGYKVCEPGDLVINTMWAWMGALGIAWERGMVSPSYNVYRAIVGEFSGEYYDYFCRTQSTVCDIIRHSKGIWKSRLRLYPCEFMDIVSLHLPLPEQRAIAAFLDRETARIDELVTHKKRLIELLQEKRSALITQAVTQGLDPSVEMKESGVEWLGRVPAGWGVLKFRRVAETSYGVGGELDRTLTEGIPILSLPNVQIDGTFNLDDIPFANVSENDKESVLLRHGDLLFNWRNGSSKHLGKTAFFDLDGEFAHVSFLLKLRFDPDKNDSKYFQALINGLRTTGFFASSKAGVNNTFNQSELNELWVIVPPLEEQKQIAEHIKAESEQLDLVIPAIEKAIDHLNEYRTALISAAVTGKVDVRAPHPGPPQPGEGKIPAG